MKGKVDLVHAPTRLVDYKSGSKDSTYQVVSKSALDPPHDTPNFQALLYLAWLRRQHRNARLEFTFFHFLETLDDVVAGEALLEDCLTTVSYYPDPFAENVASEGTFEELQEDGPGAYTKTFEQVEHGAYARVVRAHEFPDTRDSDELMASPLGEALLSELQAIVGEYAYVETGCAQALRYLRNVRDNNYFEDVLDAFEGFVQKRLEELNRYRTGIERFPGEGLGGEPNYRRVDNRDLILEGDD